MKKTVLFVYSGEIYKLPPFLAILDAMHDDYNLKVISYETSKHKDQLKKAYSNVEFLSCEERPEQESFVDKVIRHLYYPVRFHYEVKRLIGKTSYDLLWIIHESTLLEFQNSLLPKQYIITSYELRDRKPSFIKRVQKGMRNARMVISAEYNRSCIMRVYYHLDYTPLVIPNKPYFHPRKKEIPCSWTNNLKDKKIILYQGYIQRVRNINALCEAIKDMNDFTLVLMGGGDEDYIASLKEKYNNIIFTGHISPPEHLNITSYARIGVVKYDFVYLNHAYCAPNKIWEYSGFGIPTLGNDLPGLEYTIGNYGAGKCVDMDNVETIKKAIIEIDNHYDEYSRNALRFYDSFDLKQSLKDIIEKYSK